MPATDGLAAGKYFDGTTVYVGLGHPTTICVDQVLIPGRISVDTAKAGAFTECTFEMYDGNNPMYLKNNPNFKWEPAYYLNTTSIPNLVWFNNTEGGAFSFLFGRANLISSKGVVYQQVSKIHVDRWNSGMWMVNEEGKTLNRKIAFEVLTCGSCSENSA